MFYDTESSLGLDRTVHSEKCSVYAFQVLYHFLVHGCQLLVNADRPVSFGLLTFLGIGTAGAVFTAVYLFLPSVSVSFHMLPVL